MKLGMSLFAAGALVVSATAMSASAAVFVEDAGFFAAPPLDAEETNGSTTSTAIWDQHGRTVALAEVVGDSTVNLIQNRLWTNDADLWQVNVTDASGFWAWVQGGHSLAVFDSAGNALVGVKSSGGPAVGFIDASWLSGNGTYYIGMGADGSNPRNAAGENLFNLSDVPSGPVAGDIVLAADPAVAWELNNLGGSPAGLVGPGNFTRPFANVHLSIPEPASLSLLALGGVAMLRRR